MAFQLSMRHGTCWRYFAKNSGYEGHHAYLEEPFPDIEITLALVIFLGDYLVFGGVVAWRWRWRISYFSQRYHMLSYK